MILVLTSQKQARETNNVAQPTIDDRFSQPALTNIISASANAHKSLRDSVLLPFAFPEGVAKRTFWEELCRGKGQRLQLSVPQIPIFLNA